MLKLLVKKLLDFSELPVRFYRVLQTRLDLWEWHTNSGGISNEISPLRATMEKIQRHESSCLWGRENQQLLPSWAQTQEERDFPSRCEQFSCPQQDTKRRKLVRCDMTRRRSSFSFSYLDRKPFSSFDAGLIFEICRSIVGCATSPGIIFRGLSLYFFHHSFSFSFHFQMHHLEKDTFWKSAYSCKNFCVPVNVCTICVNWSWNVDAIFYPQDSTLYI